MGWAALERRASGGDHFSPIISLSLASLINSFLFAILFIITLILTLGTIVSADDMYVLKDYDTFLPLLILC
jgi:hypothetical protein